MNERIASTFARLKREGQAALVPYLTAGYPSLDMTRQLVRLVSEQGADLIELGVPFSDPLADGATVQRASHAALERGVSPADCLAVACEARQEGVTVPLLFMSYYNPIHRYGTERFTVECAACGVDGLIIPDLPPEEAGELKSACYRAGLDLIFLVAPTSTDERIERVAEMASGFIYCVSLTGLTGARTELGESAGNLVERVRRHTQLPLVVGFGISTPEHVAQVAHVADGAVVGSALIHLIERLPQDECARGVGDYIGSLKRATLRATSYDELLLGRSA
jgi:tryptophan synthase alpha chain